MDDYIKREDAIEAIRRSPISNMGTKLFCYDEIGDIPAADVVGRSLYDHAIRHAVRLSTERKTGKWSEEYKCSECGYSAVIRVEHDGSVVWESAPFNYCPNCGADMRGEA